MPDTGLQQELADLRRENRALKAKLADRDALQQERAQLFEAIEALPDGVVLFDADERLIICNEKYRELHPLVADILTPGTSFETIVKEAVMRGQHPPAKGSVERWTGERMAAFRKPGKPFEQQFADGSWRRVYERKTADGGTVGVRVDITELKVREQELRDSEARLRDYLGASSDWYWEMDSQCRFSYFSESFETLTGMSPDTLLGKQPAEMPQRGVDPKRWAEHLDALSTGQSFRDLRIPSVRADGQTVVHSVSGKAIFGPQNEFLGYRGTGREITDLVAAELSARESELQLKEAIESLSEYFVLWDKEDRLVLCNEKFRQLNQDIIEFTEPGTLLEDYFRAGLAKGLYPESEGREEAWLAEVIRAHREPGEPFEVPRKDGRWLLVHGQRMPGGGYVRTGTEVTALKRAETALQTAHDELEKRVALRTAELNETNAKLHQQVAEREIVQRDLRANQALLAAMLDNYPDLTGLRDADGRYLLVNKTFEEWYATPRERILGKSAADFWPADSAEKFKRMDADVIESRKAMIRHVDIEYPDGTSRSVRTVRFPVFVDDTTLLGIGFINTDISDLMQAQRDATEKSTQLQTVLDAIPANISMRDTNGRYLFANKKIVETGGIPAEQYIGKTAVEIYGNEGPVFIDAIMREVGETGVPVINREHGPSHLSGGTYLANIVPIRNARDEVSAVVGIGFDITEQKKLAEQLQQSQKMEAVGQLTGGVAHDFNNLLGVIIGNLELLEELLDDTCNERLELLDAAKAAAQRGANLNRQLLAFSRKQALTPQAIDLDEQIARMVSMLRRTLGETVEIELDSGPTLWLCNADPAQVEAALLNLSINARDAMPNGGRLTIRTSNQILGKDQIKGDLEVKPGEYVLLEVQDTGCGISPDALEHVFEPFYTTKEVGEGSGLGLSMVFGFAKQSNGHVMIESEEGVGTTVKLYLPRVAEFFEVGVEDAPKTPNARGETILVVEDDNDMRKLSEKLLQDLGYRVVLANDGNRALAIMTESEKIDLLLTDVVLPGGMDGTKIAAEARSRFKDIGVLFMSGYTRNHLADQSGINDSVMLIEKPFRKTELALKLREAFDA